jgi:hypothetical protein
MVQSLLELNGSVKGLQILSGLTGQLLTRTTAMEAENHQFHEIVQRKDLREHLIEQGTRAMIDSHINSVLGSETCR